MSRQFGKESYAAFLPTLKEASKGEIIEVDFEGVNTFSPSWADEFLTPLMKEYGKRLVLKKSNNLSVKSTIELLEKVNKHKYSIKK